MTKKKLLSKVTCALVSIGAINWGLVAINFNLVNWLANLINVPVLERIVYALVGLSAIHQIYLNYIK